MTALAASLASGGQFREAMTNAFEAQEIAREHLKLTVRYLSEREALGYVARRQDAVLDLALSLTDQDKDSAARLFDLLVRLRSLTLDEMAARHAAASDSSTTGVTDLRRELTSARQRLANLVVRGGRRPELHRALVATAMRDKEELERRLAETSALFRAEEQSDAVGAVDVARALPPRTALLTFYRFERSVFSATPPSAPGEAKTSYVAFVLRPGSTGPTAVRLGDADTIDGLVARWRAELDPRCIARGPAPSHGRLRELGIAVRRLVWDSPRSRP